MGLVFSFILNLGFGHATPIAVCGAGFEIQSGPLLRLSRTLDPPRLPPLRDAMPPARGAALAPMKGAARR
eukprot:5604620-Pyramimonas_sp.AAC.1